MRWIAALIVLSFTVSPCRADVIILKNGERYKGELNNRNTIQLNPLSVEKITILLEKVGSRESKLVTFDARDVDKIILEIFKAKQIIDLASLRQQSFAKTEKEGQQGDNIQQGIPVEPPGESSLPEAGIPLKSEEVHATNIRSGEKKTGIALTGGGFLALSVGAVAGFGDDRHLNAVNYILIGVGAALMSYGIFKVVQARSRLSESNVQLGIAPKGTVGLSIRWRF
ncbi:MAG: hypothetical protein GTO42_08700 [Candidatus Latescibacteria bacterium]|nr:hypothetical protein [Candidatus Latescibacterota bacterium]NIO29039.1 hypothetical protein [Candidatus Latescibacterota bacterium]NIO56664.1 hypothetical protein [Candidatus Latescibacterota bacterium]NIT02247.1 hypothetical protein [Candidatus Latescibacterota bacterium]NIT39132.1 hypothetical protein [Candidatus Latescibacterota bacterium]